MRTSRSRARLVMSWLTSSMLAVLPSCGGNSSTSPAEQGPPSQDEKSLFLVGALALDSATCVAEADANATLLAQGVMDLGLTSSYTATLLVGNQLARPGLETETERVSLRGAEITLTTADGAVFGKFSSVGTGFIDASTTSAGYGAISIDLIPAMLGSSQKPVWMDQLLIAKVRVVGEALNGTLMTSSELDFPIRVCTGCLLEYPPEAADPFEALGSGYRCATASTFTSTPAPSPCILGQDVPFSCTLCAARVEICRDPSRNPAISK